MVELKIQLPKEFLDEEERCDFVVSKQMKEIWAVELDLLAEFQRVCAKFDIHYFACGGTLLGAARHQGFIPWDDDIDLMMYREEYNKLCSHASEFKNPYFFQTEQTDRGSLRGHAQLRNSNTTGMLQFEYKKKYKFNQGIFIDIFPMDNIPDEEMACKQFKQRLKKLHDNFLLYAGRSVRHSVVYDNIYDKLLHAFFYYPCIFMMDFLYNRYESMCSTYNNEITKKCTLLMLNNYPFMTNSFFNSICYLNFEFLTLPVPCNYEQVLFELFGDWHEFVKGTSMHGGVLFDTSRTYLDYLND